jgi:hypothetical protein
MLLFALAAMINVVEQKKKLSLLSILGYGLLFFLPAFFRYMYLPTSLLLPLMIFMYGYSIKNRELRVSGIKLVAATLVFIGLQFSIASYYSGNVVHVYDTGRGVFLDQLVRWYPFLPASLINLDFAAQLTEKISGIEYTRVIFLLEILNAILFFLLCFLFYRFFLRNKKSFFEKRSILIVSGSVINLVIILMLAYLSLTYKAQDWGEYKWTYSYDVRYFAFIYVFTPILLFTSIYFYPNIFKPAFTKIFLSIIMLGFTIEVAHGIYYNLKIAANHDSLSIIRDRDKDYRSFQKIIQDLKDQNPGKEIVVSAPDQFYLHTASQMGYRSVFDYTNLNKFDLKLASKSILLMPVHKQDAWIMKEYVEKNNPQVIAIIAGTTFYKEELDAQ